MKDRVSAQGQWCCYFFCLILSLTLTLSLVNFHPEIRLFSSPSMGEGEGGGDYGPEFQDFLFSSPSPHPSPARGEGVSG
jgi:hypothetical protein